MKRNILTSSPARIATKESSTSPSQLDDISVINHLAVILDGRHLRRLSKEVVNHLKRYSPKISDRDWAVIRIFVLDAVAAAAESASVDLDRALRIAAPFVQWAVNLQGLPQEAGAVFNRLVIVGYCDSLDLADGSVATYRSILLAMADAIAPSDNPTPLPPISRRTIKDPYTDGEIERFCGWANGQRTDGRTRKAKLLLAASAGAGLKPGEVLALHPEHAVASESGVTLTIVGGQCPREVTMLAAWEEMFLEAIEGCEPGKPVWGEKRTSKNSKNLISDFAYRCDGIAPNSARLRASWLVKLLDGRVHISVIFEAGGIAKFNNLHQYLKYLTRYSVQDARAQLRGSGRS